MAKSPSVAVEENEGRVPEPVATAGPTTGATVEEIATAGGGESATAIDSTVSGATAKPATSASNPEAGSGTSDVVPSAPVAAGDAGAFFPLVANLHTQTEPAWCGFGTLVTVLNALEIDPGRVWKGPWRSAR